MRYVFFTIDGFLANLKKQFVDQMCEATYNSNNGFALFTHKEYRDKERIHTAIKIGVISDTHGLLRPAVLEIPKFCAFILQGGNVNKPELLDTLRDIVPLYVVRATTTRNEQKS